MTPKQTVKAIEPTARIDYYESLMAVGRPCYFIRVGQQGKKLSAICATPREAWRDAADSFAARVVDIEWAREQKGGAA
jgi:hypothetical protein